MQPTSRPGRWWRILCAAVCLAATAVGGQVTRGGHRADLANRTGSPAVADAEVDRLAQRLGADPAEIFRRLRDAGIDAVLAKERPAAGLEQALVVDRRVLARVAPAAGAGSLLERAAAASASRPGLSTVVLGAGPSLEELASFLEAKGAPPEVLLRDEQGRPVALGLPLASTDLDELGLGFDVDRLEDLRRQGFRIYLQYRAIPPDLAPGPRDWEALLAPARRLEAPAVFFNDRELPGYPDELEPLAAVLEGTGAAAGMIEGFDQRGFLTVARRLGYRVVRLHAIQPAELANMSQAREVERYRLAAAERNIRVLLIRVHHTDDAAADLERTLQVTEAVRAQLAAAGFDFGDPTVVVPPRVGPRTQTLMALGVAAAVVLSGDLAGLALPALVLAGLWTAGFAGLLAAAEPLQVMRVGALGAALVFPVLSLLLVARRAPRSLGAALAAYGGAGLAAAAGGLYQVAFLSHPAFMQRLTLYLGTKLSLSLPALAVGLAVALRFGHLDRIRALRGRRLLQSSVPVPWVLAGVAVAAVGFVVLTRSGNQPLVMPSALELQVRQILTEWLGVRPRFKEFAFGHVLLILALALGAGRGLAPVLFMLAAVGQMSIVNTFAHVHSPVAVVVIRWLYGLAAGAVLGAVLVLALRRLWPGGFAGAGGRPGGPPP
ncbi:MAG: hypothetical protein DIU84_02105 [Bacillota bacterium]|nr:MAG: hypothetical protein DIU84_02105 [Bacillota bacterium]